jgi:hypothetical protein
MLYAKLGFFELDELEPNSLAMILNGRQSKNTTSEKTELTVKPISLKGKLSNHTSGHKIRIRKANGQHKTNNTLHSNRAINTFIIDSFSINCDRLNVALVEMCINSCS